jgi:hypothetical protein
MNLRLKNILSIVIALASLNALKAQGVKGFVVNEQGDSLSYINILVQPDKKGANTNTNGSFEIALKPGEYTLLFRSIDYKPKQINLTIGDTWQSLKVVLSEQQYELKELNVKSNGIDPAIYIMRKAIAAAPYYRRQVLRYQAKVYIKGTGSIDYVPKLAKGLVEESTEMQVGKTYVTESVNEISFSQPFTYKEKVLSMRSTMPVKDGPEPMRMVRGSIYNTDYTGVISPLSSQAFSVYNFKLEGSFYQNGREINKIRFEPKRKGSDVYTGYLYVVEKLWCLHSCVLERESQGVKSIIKISFEQLAEQPLVWMPITYDLSFKGDYLGIKGGFRYLGSVSNYQVILNPNVNHDWLKSNIKEAIVATDKVPEKKPVLTRNQQKIETLMAKETLSKREMIQLASRVKTETERNLQKANIAYDSTEIVIDSLALKQDSNYWQSIRPVPLMESEVSSFQQYDSLQGLISGDTAKRPIASNKGFRISNVLWSGDSINFANKTYLRYGGILPGLRLNSVNGIFVSTYLSIGKEQAARPWRYVQTFQLPIGRNMPQTLGDYYYTFNPTKFGHVQLSAGIVLRDYNKQGITPLEDMFQLLFLGNNYSRWYMSEFVEGTFRYELVNGLNLKMKAAYYHRYGLENHAYFKEVNRHNDYAPNQLPLATSLANHESYQVGMSLQYRPFQTYRIKPNKKEYLKNNWPIFTLSYQTGFAQVMQFQQVDLQVHQQFNPWHWVEVQYKLQAGFFPFNGEITQPDKQYFAGNLSFITQGKFEERFNDLPYYLQVSEKQYLSWHSSYHFKRLWLKRLPYFNLGTYKESLYFNYLMSDNNLPFFEAGYMVKDLFGFLSIGLNQTFGSAVDNRLSFRVNLRL